MHSVPWEWMGSSFDVRLESDFDAVFPPKGTIWVEVAAFRPYDFSLDVDLFVEDAPGLREWLYDHRDEGLHFLLDGVDRWAVVVDIPCSGHVQARVDSEWVSQALEKVGTK